MSGPLFSAELPLIRGDIAVFSIPGASPQLNAVMLESERSIYTTLSELGRMLPVEPGRLRDYTAANGAVTGTESAAKAASALGLKAYILITVRPYGAAVIGDMKFVPVEKTLQQLGRTVSFKTRILSNVPLRFALETVHLHEGLPVIADIISASEGTLTVKAGQWHGITEGSYSAAARPFNVISAGRYHSVITGLPGAVAAGRISIDIYPDTKNAIEEIGRRIQRNINSQFGPESTLLKNSDSEKRFVESICIINPGANICLPGYGSFLASGYLGFKNKKADVPGVLFSTALITGQLAALPAASGFSMNFFPWIQDSDKSDRQKDLHVFLWSTLPLTITAAYFDQLAVLYRNNDTLPPFYLYRDETALALSLIFPGTGLMYKGKRTAGWAYYLTEMALAGTAVYNRGSGNIPLFSIGALAAVKIAELVHAYSGDADYKIHTYEYEKPVVIPEISSLNIPGSLQKETYYSLRAGINF